MKFSKIKETCLYVHDLEKAKAFYHGLLALPVISYVEGKHIFFRAGSSVLLCFDPDDSKTKTSPPPHYAEGKQHFAFEVAMADYADVKAEIESKGIAIIDRVVWSSGRESFYFNDWEGNILEVLPDAGIWE
ncbi:VOC family protein [Chryseolinea lacunae]|uniref:VOC family protein n=1 Tax=Chryseolinea lacunae TaxID=2801331 RepID=A0ABS1KQJ0_9BACT|nr:VOC family protein [Chryseolinea lacunae]MBL0741753.1 VOC family protein [Chryseolinea lacunae]